MSTSYYELAEPWSSLRVDDNGTHARLHVWSDGKKSGELVVASDEAGAACRSLANPHIDNSYGCNATTVGRQRGTALYIRARPRSRVVVSEYGEPIEWDRLLDDFDLTADGRTITDADRWTPRT